MLRGREIGEPFSWLLGLAAITLALAKINRLLNPHFYTDPYFISIIIAFIIHELAHRYVGRLYGLKTEFVATTTGLLITALTGVLPNIVVLAPGYVRLLYFAGYPLAGRALLYSTAAGPASNIVLAIIAAALGGLAPGGSWLHSFLAWTVWVNAWIAFFNLIPIPPLDGSKIARLDVKLWAIMMLASFALLIAA